MHFVLLPIALWAASFLVAPQSVDDRAEEERLTFVARGPWSPGTNVNADVAIINGVDNIATWKQHGYAIHVMTGEALHAVRVAIDAGAVAIHFEEPVFWVRHGEASPDAQYQASKLKYFLNRQFRQQVLDFAKSTGRHIRCYVSAHSLLNYAQWRMVSPEAGADGYVAKVWADTARTPNFYEGRRGERLFETAFLEYGAMKSFGRVWFLSNPVDNHADHGWNDYRKNWESTVTASLLHPEVWRYEITPHPELQAVIHALGEMKQSNVQWIHVGTRGTGVLVSDTMMFQRGEPNPSDATLGSFYGLTMPLLKRGLPVEPVHIESGDLDRYRLLLLTYEGQKPPKPDFHDALSKWVRQGGALVVVDDDRDPYNAVREWWNTAPRAFETPRQHLFEALGLDKDAAGMHRVGRGVVLRATLSPAALTYKRTGAETVRALARQAAAAVKLTWKETGAMVLRRGPYIVAAGLEGSQVLRGRFIDLFDPELPVVSTVTITSGKRALLYDLDAVQTASPSVVAAACRVPDELVDGSLMRFRTSGIAGTQAVVRIAARKPLEEVQEVLVGGKPLDRSQYDVAKGALRLRFPNSADGVEVQVRFAN